MPFLGVQPTDTFAAVAKQTLTGDLLGTTVFTLDHGVSSANDIALYINNVRQEPVTAYTASGNTLTLTESINAADDAYLIYIARTFQSLSIRGITDNTEDAIMTIDGSLTTGGDAVLNVGQNQASGYYVQDKTFGFEISNGGVGGNTAQIKNAGNVILSHNQIQDNLILRTNNTGRVTILSGGNVGIGVTDPDEKLEISGGDLKVDTNGNAGVIHFGPTSDLTKIIGRDTGSGTLPNTLDFYVNSANVSRLDARNASFGGGYTINASVDTSYAVLVGAGYGAVVSGDNGGRGLFGTNVTTTTANVPVIANTHGGYGGIGLDCSWGVAKIVRKGGAVTAGDTLDTVVRFDNDGLKFGSDTAAANALDDYEEGDWTPVLRTSNLDGSYSIGTVFKASYRKIGSAVFYSFYVTGATQITQGTGTMQIGGLPFNSLGNLYSGGLSTYGPSLTNGLGARQIIQSGNAFIRLINENTGQDLAASAWSNQANMIIAGMYFTA